MARDIEPDKEIENSIPAGWGAAEFLGRVTTVLPNIVYVFNQLTQSNEFTNRSIGSMMGYSQDEVTRMGAELMPSICHPEDLPRVFAHFHRISRLRDTEIAKIEYRVRHKKGYWVWLLSQDAVFDRDEWGKVTRHIGVATDITEQKNAEAKASAEAFLADAANEELRAFAYSVSHDMKSPTNTVRLLLEEALENLDMGDAESVQDLIEKTLETVHRLQDRIGNVLDYTNVIGRETRAETVELDQVVQNVMSDLEFEISKSRAVVEVGELPTVIGSSRKMGLLLQNLITNSIKYRKPDVKPVIRIFESSEPEDDMIAISIVDNGIGISPVYHERVFEMFQRLHHDEDIPGNGLGLAICRRIARSHGGEIELQSEADQGASFTVRLSRNDGTLIPRA